MTIEQQAQQVLSRVSFAAERSGRSPQSVQVIAVSKTVDRPAVEEAAAAGLRDFGENRVQDAMRKFQTLPAEDCRLHLIGYLQTNKVRDAVRLFSIIHSVDRPSLVQALQHRAALEEKQIEILLQVNVAREEQKHGCAPEDTLSLLRLAAEQSNLRVRGLMTIAPLVPTAEDARQVFRDLRALRDDVARTVGVALPELSMGMTNDFEVAIEEGATMIRVGRAIFA